jgi:TonB family protein
VPAPTPAIEAPAPAVAPPAPDVVAIAPPPEPPAPPVGRFFETRDVNELPHVATRVEPQLPDELRTRPLNDVIIVRALVSQGGHPSHISLLRRSKAGPRLDNAVIAAVNQWTFSPARRRGEAVSCWFNFGVPVGGAD